MINLPDKLIVTFIRLNILFIAFSNSYSIRKAISELKRIRRIQKGIRGSVSQPRVFKGGGKYFINPNIPGWPSAAFTKFFRNEINANYDENGTPAFPHILIFSITQKCPLKCKHCFEWDRLAGADLLTSDDLKKITDKFENAGTVQFQFGGGEPLLRIDDFTDLIRERKSESWLLTSGFGLTPENAVRLRKAGLTGMKISIDHYEEDKHNSFRGNCDSFGEAVNAVKISIESGLATGIAACITEENANREFLVSYLEFARSLGAGFVFLLEPRETGHFKNSNVTLSENAVESIRKFYLECNSGKAFRKMPVVIYPGFHQREKGCFGAGYRYLYTDSAGFAHACPFCQGAGINVLNTDVTDIVNSLREKGCHMFKSQYRKPALIDKKEQ
jgi:MoaA/NifB/PqqE/SkfB family radical SAM enzyme